MAKSERDMAFEAADASFQDLVKKLTDKLNDCLIQAEDDQAKKKCADACKKGLALAKAAHKLSREVVDQAFPG